MQMYFTLYNAERIGIALSEVKTILNGPTMTSSNGTFSALLAICAGDSPVTCAFPSRRPVTRSFGVFFYLCLNKRLRKQLCGWWFGTPSRSWWRHCYDKGECMANDQKLASWSIWLTSHDRYHLVFFIYPGLHNVLSQEALNWCVEIWKCPLVFTHSGPHKMDTISQTIFLMYFI